MQWRIELFDGCRSAIHGRYAPDFRDSILDFRLLPGPIDLPP